MKGKETHMVILSRDASQRINKKVIVVRPALMTIGIPRSRVTFQMPVSVVKAESGFKVHLPWGAKYSPDTGSQEMCETNGTPYDFKNHSHLFYVACAAAQKKAATARKK